MIVAPLTATVLADADDSDAGIATGVNNAVARVAGLLGIAVVGVAVAGSSNELDLHGYRIAMAITAGLIGVGRRHRLRRDQEPPSMSVLPREIVFDRVTKRYEGRDARRAARALARRSRRAASACSSARRAAARRPR